MTETRSELRRKQKKKKEEILKKRRRSVLIMMGEMIFCLLLGITAYCVSIFNAYAYEEISPSVYKESTAEKEIETETSIIEVTNEAGDVYETSQVYIPVDKKQTGYRNILILGVDAEAAGAHANLNQKGLNTDVIIVASVNNETGDIKMVSVLRDTIMKMEEGSSSREYDKCNGQFSATGDISTTVSMINRNLGLDIDEYVIVNWYGVARCIDELGGVELTIPNEQFRLWLNGYLDEVNHKTNIWAPPFEQPGTYVMRGTQAVAFCRIRYGGGNDEGRTANQREVIMKMVDRVKTLLKNGDPGTVLSAAEAGLSNVKTNLKPTEMLYLATEMQDFNIAGSTSFPHEYKAGQYLGNYYDKYRVVDPSVACDFANEVRQLHAFLFDDNDYEPTDFIKEISLQMQMDAEGR